MNLGRVIGGMTVIGNQGLTAGSRSNTSLNTAYTHAGGAGNNAIAIRWMALTADPIDELYIFLDAVTGTLANVSMECKIYNEGTNQHRAGTTLRDTSTTTTMPSAADMWIKFAFGTPYTPAVGEILWFVCYNTAASPAVDYPQIMITSTWAGANAGTVFHATGYTTTAGFASDGTIAQETPFVVVAGTNYSGLPWTRVGLDTYTSNTRQRGFVVTPTSDIKVYGVEFNTSSASSALNELKIYDNTTIPGGTALHTFDLDSDANETTGDVCKSKVFDSAVTLTGGVTYKIALTYSSSSAIPHKLEIEDYSSYSSVFDALRAFNQLSTPWGCISDGGAPEAWVIDKSICPGIYLLVDDTVAASGGGGQRVFGGG